MKVKADIVHSLRVLGGDTPEEGALIIEELRHALNWALNRLEEDADERAKMGDLTMQIKRLRRLLPRGRK